MSRDKTIQRSQSVRHAVFRIVALYALLGSLWIYVSDTIVEWFVKDPDVITRISVFKGLAFILLTSMLLSLLITRYMKRFKEAEDRIRLLNKELEQRVLDRTAELESSNKELEAFAYTISHDLRSPLRHIDGYVHMLQKRTGMNMDEQSRHYMDSISSSAIRMASLIDNLLSFSRLSRQETFSQPVDMSALLKEVINELEPETQGRNIQWQVADLPGVMGDRSMLRVVLTNLISNALKFTSPRPQAQIEIGSFAGNDGQSIFFIRDNGVGFDMNYYNKLFGVFQRLHPQEVFEGTGIGLATVQRIIQRHGGKIWAESEVDGGATFFFWLKQAPQKSAKQL